MADITFTIPDNIATRVLDGVAYQHGYKDLIDGQPNPQTKLNFVKEKTRQFWKECVIAWEANSAANTARDSAVASVNSQVNI